MFSCGRSGDATQSEGGNMRDVILTVQEAARLLKTNADTIRRLCRKGELPAGKIGKSWRLSRKALFDHVHGRTPAAQSASVQPKPLKKAKKAGKGAWTCPCGTGQSGRYEACIRCGKPKPEAA